MTKQKPLPGAQKPIKYKGHEITPPDRHGLGMWFYGGPLCSGGTWSLEDAKRTIRRRHLQPTCEHKRSHQAQAVGAKNIMVFCNRCDKLLRIVKPGDRAASPASS